MSKTLSPDHPNLIQAVMRLKRILRAWAALLLLMGLFNAALLWRTYPLSSLPWIAAAIAIIIGHQPASLALIAVLWGLSGISLIPNVSTLIGPDPISHLLQLSTIEGIALGVVRVLLLIMAWNQFMFYRMLYGTEGISSLPGDLPAIPEMVPNRTGQLARAAQVIGIIGLVAVWGSVIIDSYAFSINLLTASFAASILAIGLGVGVSFSPTSHRKYALSAVGIGLVVFLSIFLVGRLTLLQ